MGLRKFYITPHQLMIVFLLKKELGFFFRTEQVHLVRANFASSSNTNNDNSNAETKRKEQGMGQGGEQQQLLMTRLFAEKCVGDNYTTYKTPIDECYNGNNQDSIIEKDRDINSNSLPPIMSSWISNPYGDHDIKDELVNVNDEAIGVFRSFYQSTNGTCMGDVTDSFPNIPLNSCVGPFGEPYPWGTLKLISPTSENEEMVAVL